MQNDNRLEEFCLQQGIHCQRNVPLSEYCTFRIGGPADLFIAPDSEKQLAALLPFVSRQKIPLLILGKGSNILFSDAGFRGAVIHIAPSFGEIRLLDHQTIFCGAGVPLIHLCQAAYDHALTGLEFAYGIPGSVGGAIYMNAGAYGGEMKDILLSAQHLQPDGVPGSYQGQELNLSYRHSVYTDSDLVITGGTFRLQPGNREQIRARMDDLMSRRRDKQPLDFPSAGSTFKRPEGAYASALIDQCGLKGFQIGGAQVSEKHAGFLINTGNATGADVRALITEVQKQVQAQTGYWLECEVKTID